MRIWSPEISEPVVFGLEAGPCVDGVGNRCGDSVGVERLGSVKEGCGVPAVPGLSTDASSPLPASYPRSPFLGISSFATTYYISLFPTTPISIGIPPAGGAPNIHTTPLPHPSVPIPTSKRRDLEAC